MTLKKRGGKIFIERVNKMPIGELKRSWWLDAAQPDQRESFTAAAAERNAMRAHEVNLREMRQLYTQGVARTGRKV